uniref:Uncharacterized protein n=1 Tax=Tanacetum cinerariifolium TaxID=118510 RepID=A0A6L2JY18_TANCI|nr:hypothetical protein [Tanacetum cinerariifolium]
MNPIATQQASLDNALDPFKNRLKIKRCNARIAFTKPQKEEAYQFWNTIKKIGKIDAYDFKLDKKKCRVDTEVFHEIHQICPRLPNQDFVELPFEDDLLSFIKEFGYSGNCKMLSTIRTDQIHHPWRTFAAVINKCIFGKTTGLDRLRESRAQIIEISSARKEHMPYLRFTKVIINHFISKDNTIPMRNRINLHNVYDDTLLATLKFASKIEDYQKYGTLIPDGMTSQYIKDFKAYKTYVDYATGKVPPKRQGSSRSLLLLNSRLDDDSWGNSEDENDDFNDEDDDSGNDDDIGNNDDDGNDAQDSEQTDLGDDGNPSFTLKDYEEEETQEDEYVHTPIKNASHEFGFVHEKEDAYVTLTTVHDKTEGPLQSSSVSSDFTSKLLNLYDPSSDINSLMDTSTVPPSSPPVNPCPHLTTITPQLTPNSTTTTTNATMSLPEIPNFASLFQFDQRYLASKVKEAVDVEIIKEQVKAQVSKIMPQIEMYVTESLGAEVLIWISTIAKARQPPHTSNELMGTPIDFSTYVMNRLKINNPTQEILVRLAFNLLKGTCKSFVKLEYHFEECYKAFNDRLDWHNPKGREYLFDLSKPLSLIEDRGRQVVSAEYFINNDLDYLKGGSSSSKYVTSTTRTKAAKYDNIEGIIIKVTSVKVMRWYDYGYLEEIVVRRSDNVLYKFKEGNFPGLILRDIEDMLLLLVQKKLSSLDVDDRYDLGVALRMFTRRIVILHHVEDLQLGVESYQKKINITRPETTRSNISY